MLCVIACDSLPRRLFHFASKICSIGQLRIPGAIVILQCGRGGSRQWNDKKINKNILWKCRKSPVRWKSQTQALFH